MVGPNEPWYSYAKQLFKLPKAERYLLKHSIRLVLCQVRALSDVSMRRALLHGLQTTYSMSKYELLPRLSNGLIIRDADTGKYHFADPSVGTYIASLAEYRSIANHEFMATCCLRYLSSDEVVKRLVPVANQHSSGVFLNDFHQYACLYWAYHLAECGDPRLSSE